MTRTTQSHATLLFTLLLVFGSASCSEDGTGVDPNDVGTITGRIVDSATGAPVSAALLSTVPSSSTTISASDGSYSLAGIDVGSYRLVVEAGGYLTKELDVDVAGAQVATVDVVLSVDPEARPVDSLLSMLRFDGEGDYVLIGDNNAVDLSGGSYTIELWCRPNRLRTVSSSGLDNRWNFLVSHGQNDIDLDYSVAFEDEAPAFFSRRKESGHVGEATIQKDEWYHVAVVQDVDASELRIYINGQLDSRSTLRGSEQQSAADVFVGAREDNGTGEPIGFFDGEIFDLRMWDVVRTKEQIEFARWRPLSGTEFGLVGYWPMNDGSGSLLSEKSGKNLPASVDGAIWLTVRNPMFR